MMTKYVYREAFTSTKNETYIPTYYADRKPIKVKVRKVRRKNDELSSGHKWRS